MKDRNLYAHSLPGEPPEKWQPLEVHLRNVAEMAAKFAQPFYSTGWAFNAGILHDLGKALTAFQSYLLRQNGLDDPEYDAGNHNHSSAGAAFALDKYGECAGKIYAYLAAGHHAGLPDWFSDKTGNAALSVRLKEGKENLAKMRDFPACVFQSLQDSQKPDFVKPNNLHFWIRMLFSCLVDADSLDTEKSVQSDRAALRADSSSVRELKERFDRHMEEMASSAADTHVNRIRWQILKECIRNAGERQGIFSLSVPTGGGKTLSSLAFALHHAAQHGKRRIIYVIPYTSIIEQTADIFKKIFGTEQVLEHHSSIDAENQPLKMELASENWDASLIVTTSVQFFESLYAAKRSRCRKLHNIADSVVILDEAQLMPPQFLAPCVWGLKELTRNYGVTVLLSTATQPSLRWIDGVRELISEPSDIYRKMKRVEVLLPADLNARKTWEELADDLKKHGQVLCIVNSRRDCHELYQKMPKDTIHLSALMCGEHRSRVIRYVKWRLKKKKPIRVISTQLVEAGVDIDFPVVYRALAGFDSIAQAAGRCNREGELDKGHLIVFIPPKPVGRGILGKGEDAAMELTSLGQPDFDSPDTFRRYFELFYASLNSVGEEQFQSSLARDVFNIAFRSYADEFRIIDEKDQRPVIVRFKNSDEHIARLKQIGRPVRDIMRKLQRFTVSLHARTVAQMLQDGRLEEVFPRSGIYVQTVPGIYSRKTGLDIYSQSIPTEDLII